MKQGGSRLLYRAIATHLVVAVAPAVILGAIVITINRDALTTEAQQVHLSVAGQLRAELLAGLDRIRLVLDQAERTLDTTEVPIETRQTMLRALVAGQHIPYLVFYGPDGAFDSVMRLDEGHVDRRDLDDRLKKEADRQGYVVDDVDLEARTTRVAVPWRRDAEVLGYVGTVFDVGALDDVAAVLAKKHLDEGEIAMVDGAGRYLVASSPGRVGQHVTDDSPFGSIRDWTQREGLAAVEAGRSMRYVDGTGVAYLGTILSAPAVRWLIGTSRPERVALASVDLVKVRVITLALAAALAGGLVGLLLARQVSEPVRRLTNAVRQSARTGFIDRVSASGAREVGLLAGAFNDALGELQRYRDTERKTTQLRLRLSRYLSPDALHELFAAERRDVGEKRDDLTVVYVDLAGAEPLIDVVAQENLITILGEFFSAACASVERNKGRVDRYSGDAVIGVFSGESAEQRTLQALAAANAVVTDATAIADRWGAVFSASVGLVSGTGVVVASPDSPNDISVSGELVDRAAALQREANPGAIVMDPPSRAALGDQAPSSIVERMSQTTRTERVFEVQASDTSQVEKKDIGS